MPKLGLGAKTTNSGLVTPGIVTDNLVLKHNYNASSVIPVSDGAASFVTTDTDYITTNFIPDYIHTNASMGMWVYFKSISEQTMGHHGGLRWYMGIDGNGDCFMGVADAHTGSDNVSGGIVANTWLHIAVTAIDGTATYYVNGVAKHTKSYTQNSVHNPDEGWYIGARNNNGAAETHMDAYVANVFQYNIGLTQAQIKSIMNKNYDGLADSEKTNLVSWWNLDESHETNVAGQGPIVYDNHHSGLTTYGDELLNWDSNFTGTGISTGNVGDFITNANNSTTFTYIDNDNKTLRLQNDSDGDHVQIKHEPSSAILEANSAYKMVVTVTSLTGRWRIRPAADDPDADMTAPGTYTFLWNSSDSTYWRVERDATSQVNDITISDIKIYKINGNVGLLV